MQTIRLEGKKYYIQVEIRDSESGESKKAVSMLWRESDHIFQLHGTIFRSACLLAGSIKYTTRRH